MIGGSADLVAIQYDPEADREEWLAERVRGIGGSDAAAVVGEHPQKSAIDVWSERITGVDVFQDSERSIVGRLLEPTVIQWFAAGGDAWPRSAGKLTVIKPPSVYHRGRPWFRGSADGLVYEQEAIAYMGDASAEVLLRQKPQALLEVKTHGWFGSRGYSLNDDGSAIVSVPPDKRIQCAWYMALYDVDVAYLAALVDTHLRKTFVLHRDRELEDMLLTENERFWTRHVLTGEPPPPDGTERYRKYLGDRFKKHREDLVESTPEVEQAVAQLIAVKRQQKLLEKERERSEQVIKMRIGDAAGVRTSLGAITWKSQPSGKLRDKDARAALYLALGWTDDEIEAFETRYAQPDHRVMRTPK